MNYSHFMSVFISCERSVEKLRISQQQLILSVASIYKMRKKIQITLSMPLYVCCFFVHSQFERSNAITVESKCWCNSSF